jgi:hypothetical protein
MTTITRDTLSIGAHYAASHFAIRRMRREGKNIFRERRRLGLDGSSGCQPHSGIAISFAQSGMAVRTAGRTCSLRAAIEARRMRS